MRGKQLSVQCFACHGTDGNSPSPVNPKIGGQHEEYLVLALRAYADGTRPDSLMSGAVLDKSDQDLRDIAAYFARQPVTDSATAGPGRDGGGPPMNFDHGDRDSEYTSMLARARGLFTVLGEMPDDELCRALDGAAPVEQDDDDDGLPNRYDAAPDNPGEFVIDENADGSYEICNIHQLQAIGTLGTAEGKRTPLSIEARRERSYQLVRDLDAAGLDFEPIGDCGPTGNCMKALGQFGFAGVLDGRGYTIRNVSISRKERGGVGLFGVLASSGVVMNLNLTNVDVEGRAGVGSVVGSNFGTVYNCQAIGSVEGAMAIGGLVGGSGGLVFDSRFVGRVTGKQAVGGLVGDMTGAVYRSSSDVEVTGVRGIGGLVGLNTFGSILDSYAESKVIGDNDVGGLVGVNTDAKIRNSYAVGTVVGGLNDVGGNNIGGLVGFSSQSSVRNSYARSRVSGANAVGGLIGRNKGAIDNSYATGSVSGAGESGALVGFIVEGRINGSYVPGNMRHGGADSGAGIRVEPSQLDGNSTGWAPIVVPMAKPQNFFCDLNRNGYIDPAEWRAENYIWDFGRSGDVPAVRCVPDGIEKQRPVRVSTAQPFEKGDIFVAATVMDDHDDDHKGTGRLLQYDADLTLKGTLWIDGTTHKIGGLVFGPDGTLWGSAPISWQVIEIGPDGRQKPMRKFADRTFSSVTFGPDGSLYFGEHLIGNKTKIAFNTTVFSYVPGLDVIGEGKIYKFSPDGELLEVYETDTHGGIAGIHGITSTVLTDDGRRMIYISETGNRIMQYDLTNRKQLPDLVDFGKVDGGPPMVLVMAQMPDGELVIGTGRSIVFLDQDTGEITKEIEFDRPGWAAVAPSIDAGYVLLGNFFDGEFIKVRVADGEIVARNTIGEQRSLSGIAQYAGD